MVKKSDNIVTQAPLSFTGAYKRIMNIGESQAHLLWKIPAIFIAWSIIISWYFTFTFMLIPFRIMRRNQRKQKLEQKRHQELLKELKKR